MSFVPIDEISPYWAIPPANIVPLQISTPFLPQTIGRGDDSEPERRLPRKNVFGQRFQDEYYPFTAPTPTTYNYPLTPVISIFGPSRTLTVVTDDNWPLPNPDPGSFPFGERTAIAITGAPTGFSFGFQPGAISAIPPTYDYGWVELPRPQRPPKPVQRDLSVEGYNPVFTFNYQIPDPLMRQIRGKTVTERRIVSLEADQSTFASFTPSTAKVVDETSLFSAARSGSTIIPVFSTPFFPPRVFVFPVDPDQPLRPRRKPLQAIRTTVPTDEFQPLYVVIDGGWTINVTGPPRQPLGQFLLADTFSGPNVPPPITYDFGWDLKISRLPIQPKRRAGFSLQMDQDFLYFLHAEEETAGTFGPAGRPGKRRRRKPKNFDGNWPGMIWPNEKPRVPEPPSPVPQDMAPSEHTNPRPVAFVPPKGMVKSLSKKSAVMAILDPEIRRKAIDMQRRLKRELDEDEILLLMGLFD